MMSRCPKSGARVTFTGTPAAVAFYRGAPAPFNHSPAPGEKGTIVAIPTMGGKKTCMRGPGGGMVYVDWDSVGIVGVLRVHTSLGRKK